MSGKVHIWWKPERYHCGLVPKRVLSCWDYETEHVHAWEPGGATCLHCLKSLRDASLWTAAKSAEQAHEASLRYDQVQRQRARKAKKAVEGSDANAK